MPGGSAHQTLGLCCCSCCNDSSDLLCAATALIRCLEHHVSDQVSSPVPPKPATLHMSTHAGGKRKEYTSETPLDAAVRKLEEETHWQLDSAKTRPLLKTAARHYVPESKCVTFGASGAYGCMHFAHCCKPALSLCSEQAFRGLKC